MTSPELDNLVRIGQLKAEPGAQAEFDGLLRSGGTRCWLQTETGQALCAKIVWKLEKCETSLWSGS
jgi:hypothetical protein